VGRLALSTDSQQILRVLRQVRAAMPPLDGVRGLAILAVLLLHLRAPDLTHPLKGILGFGWIGVHLFFVLSGFLITGILLDTRGATNYFQSFWARRTLRIFPLYFFALTLLLVVLPRVVQLPAGTLPPARHGVYFWSYLNNWVPLEKEGDLEHILGHFWSLAVEEQFYLLWPMVVWLLPSRRLARECASACLLILALRIWFYAQGLDEWMIYRNTVLRADALLAGSITAILLRDRRAVAWLLPRRGRLLASTFAAALALLAASGGTHATRPLLLVVGPTVFAGAFAALLVAAVLGMGSQEPLQRLLTWAPLRATGRYAYGLYVWNWPIAWALYQSYPGWPVHGAGGQALLLAVGLAATAVAAGLSYHLLESPLLRLKTRFAARRGPLDASRAHAPPALEGGGRSPEAPAASAATPRG